MRVPGSTTATNVALVLVGSGTDHISLLILFLLFLLGRPYFKKPKAQPIQNSYRDEIWHDYSSSKYASIDGVVIKLINQSVWIIKCLEQYPL